VARPAFFDDVADLVLGRQCLGCGTFAPGLCPRCLGGLRGQVHTVPGTSPVGHAAVPYADLGRRLVLSYKERGYLSLALPLGWLLADAVWAAMRASGSRDCVLVPVPGHRRSRRGFDAVGAIASEATRALSRAGIHATQERLLRGRSAYPALKGLGRSARRAAVEGAFVATAPPRFGQCVILVDDIITTGATSRSAVAALEQASIRVAGVAAVAATTSPGTSATSL